MSQSGLDLTLANKIVDYLNELIQLDKEAMNELFHFYTKCNNNLLKHPTVQCKIDSVGFLGILNGLCGAENDIGAISAVFNWELDEYVLREFIINEKTSKT